jgi:hypothetical protein
MIRNLKFATLVLFTVVSASVGAAQIQKRPPSFVIDRSKPYVYLEFDHLGKRQPLSRHEPDRGLWIRLVNNCQLPITVATFNTETSDPGIGVDDEIVRVDLNAPALAHGLRAGERPPNEQPNDSIPEGYRSGDVVNTTTVAPGTSLLLSLPANHVGPSWYLQIQFYLNVPMQSSYRYGPYSVVSFNWQDIPEKFRQIVRILDGCRWQGASAGA